MGDTLTEVLLLLLVTSIVFGNRSIEEEVRNCDKMWNYGTLTMYGKKGGIVQANKLSDKPTNKT